MTTAPQYIETDLELTEEEHEHFTERAQAVGLDLESFVRVLVLLSSDLPKPYSFLTLMERFAKFTTDYRAHMHAVAEGAPNTEDQSKTLAEEFARLVQDWDALYGPR